MADQKISFFLKETLSFFSYIVVGFVACFLAFLIVVQFLNPALSEDKKNQIQLAQNKGKNQLSNIVEGIKKNVSDAVKTLTSNRAQQAPAKPQKAMPPSGNLPAPQESLPAPPSGDLPPSPSGNLPAPQESLPAPPSGDLPPPPSGNLPAPANANLPPPPSGNLPAPANANLPPSPSGNLPAPANANLPPSPSGNLPAPQENLPAPPSGNISKPSPPSELSSQGGSGSTVEVENIMSPFIYDPEHRRDPFEDPTEVKESETIVFVPKTPPEEYNLNQIKLKGIIWDTKSPKALFQLPGEGGFYTLLKGDKLGKNGTIFEIREDEVVIVETIVKVTGKAKTEAESQVKIIKLDRLRL